MPQVFRILAVLVVFLGSAGVALADIYWDHVGHDVCNPPGARSHKDTYAAHDGSPTGKLLGWAIYNCDGTETWLPNETSTRRGPSNDGANSQSSKPPVSLELLRYFTRDLPAMQRMAGGAEITVSTTNKIFPELGSVERMTIRVRAGILSPLVPRSDAPVLKMNPRLAPAELR